MLATMPGGELVDHLVEDEAGQDAVAVRFPERVIEDGEVAGGNAYIVKAVVDEAGRRP